MGLNAGVCKGCDKKKKHDRDKNDCPEDARDQAKTKGGGEGRGGEWGEGGPGEGPGRGEIEFEQKRLPGTGINA